MSVATTVAPGADAAAPKVVATVTVVPKVPSPCEYAIATPFHEDTPTATRSVYPSPSKSPARAVAPDRVAYVAKSVDESFVGAKLPPPIESATPISVEVKPGVPPVTARSAFQSPSKSGLDGSRRVSQAQSSCDHILWIAPGPGANPAAPTGKVPVQRSPISFPVAGSRYPVATSGSVTASLISCDTIGPLWPYVGMTAYGTAGTAPAAGA